MDNALSNKIFLEWLINIQNTIAKEKITIEFTQENVKITIEGKI